MERGLARRLRHRDRPRRVWTPRSWTIHALLALAAATSAASATRTEVYQEVTATITVPDVADAGVDFGIDVEGLVAGGTSPTSYEVWLDATWAYDGAHRARVSAGTLVDRSIFEIGDYRWTYIANHAPGSYRYTFIFGDRGSVHAWYDVATEIAVTVGPCVAGSVPAGVPMLTMTTARIAWQPLRDATHHDVLRGVLAALRASRGDFAAAGLACLAEDVAGAVLDYSDPPGEDAFFLVRGANCAGSGTQESGDPAQLEPRDAEISASGADCR